MLDEGTELELLTLLELEELAGMLEEELTGTGVHFAYRVVSWVMVS